MIPEEFKRVDPLVILSTLGCPEMNSMSKLSSDSGMYLIKCVAIASLISGSRELLKKVITSLLDMFSSWMMAAEYVADSSLEITIKPNSSVGLFEYCLENETTMMPRA